MTQPKRRPVEDVERTGPGESAILPVVHVPLRRKLVDPGLVVRVPEEPRPARRL